MTSRTHNLIFFVLLVQTLLPRAEAAAITTVDPADAEEHTAPSHPIIQKLIF